VSIFGSSPAPPPQGDKTTASHDKTRQSAADNRTGDARVPLPDLSKAKIGPSVKYGGLGDVPGPGG
jgi:hypothetical protein